MTERNNQETATGGKRLLKRALIVAVLALVTYANNLGHDWAYDDHEYIVNNDFVENPARIADIFSTTYLYGVDGIQTGLYRPVTILSYALNAALTGLRPSLFHLVNDLLHAANSVLVLFVILSLTGGSNIAFFTALLFATHPVHTEAVDNVVGRAELLAFLFSMLTLLFHSMRGRRFRVYYPLSLACFMLALMSKEVAAALPVVILLLVVGENLRGERKRIGSPAAGVAGYFAVLAVYMAVRHVVIARLGPVPGVMFSDNPLAGMPFMERLPTALAVLVKYLLLLLFPFRLSADYSYNQVPILESLFGIPALAGLAVVAGAVFALGRSANRSPVLYTGTLLLALPFLVFSNILFPTGTIMGERLLYTPSLGFCLLLAWGVRHMFVHRLNRPSAARWIVTAIVVFYGGRSFARNFAWKDNDTIFSATARTSPNSVKNSYNYALALKRRGRIDEAIHWYRRAVDIWPGHQSAWFNLGNALRERGRLREAVDAYDKAIELLPSDIGAMHNLALTYKTLEEPEKAVAVFKRILLTRPDDVSVFTNIAVTWAECGEYDKALEILERLAKLNPGDAGTLTNIGNIHVARGDTSLAVSYYAKAVELDPASPQPNNALLSLCLNRGDIVQARERAAMMKRNGVPIMRRLAERLQQ